jgi:NitT/TauT family transport system substrate-binding protein
MAKKISRRNFVKQSTGLVATGFTSNIFIPEGFSQSQTTLKIGYLPITDAAPLLIAYAKNFFQDEGLTVPRPKLVRAWSILAESFMANRFNITHLLFPIPLWMRYKNKMPVKVLAWDHTNGSAITVRANSGINNFSDFGGKQIAVPYWYSMHNMILQMGLRTVGLTPVIRPQSQKLKPNEVNLFILPPPEMPSALLGRKIDGFIVAEPFNALSEIKLKAKIFRFVGDIWKNHPCCVVVANDKLIKESPVFTGKITNAIARAQLWLNKNRFEAAKILSTGGMRLLPQSEAVLKRALSAYDVNVYGSGQQPQAIRHPNWGINRIDFQPYPYPSATNLIIENMKKTKVEGSTDFLNQLESRFIVKDLVDDRFVKEAVNNLGGVSQFPQTDINNPWSREEIIAFN